MLSCHHHQQQHLYQRNAVCCQRHPVGCVQQIVPAVSADWRNLMSFVPLWAPHDMDQCRRYPFQQVHLQQHEHLQIRACCEPIATKHSLSCLCHMSVLSDSSKFASEPVHWWNPYTIQAEVTLIYGHFGFHTETFHATMHMFHRQFQHHL